MDDLMTRVNKVFFSKGEDYVEQEIFLQNFQQANRLIGMIHRSLANAHVPLSQIPPRALMAQSALKLFHLHDSPNF